MVGQGVVLRFLQKPLPGEDSRQHWAMVNAASEYYEFQVAMVLLIIGFFFYKNNLRNLMGKDIKQVINS